MKPYSKRALAALRRNKERRAIMSEPEQQQPAAPQMSVPNELTPALRAALPRGSCVVQTVVVRKIMAPLPNGSLGQLVAVEYPDAGDGELAVPSMDMLAKGIVEIIRNEAVKESARNPPIEIADAAAQTQLLRRGPIGGH